MYNHNKAQQSKNRVHISWDLLYVSSDYGGGEKDWQLFANHEWAVWPRQSVLVHVETIITKQRLSFVAWDNFHM